MFQGPLTESILQRAKDKGLIDISLHDLREYGLGQYKQVDDSPYGGGAGMVMRVDVVVGAIEEVMKEFHATSSKFPVRPRPGGQVPSSKQNSKLKTQNSKTKKLRRILLSARGTRLTQEKVEELSRCDHLLLLCGHYEGIDQRIIEGGWIDEEISIGDYVLTGGELPAMVLTDAIARQIPGVLGKEESAQEESFSESLNRKREYPHYTRPEEYQGLRVPDVLLSGNHAEIEKWRRDQLS